MEGNRTTDPRMWTGREAAELGADVGVEERVDGEYGCSYSVAEGAGAQAPPLEVRVNGGHVCGSPFAVAIEEELG